MEDEELLIASEQHSRCLNLFKLTCRVIIATTLCFVLYMFLDNYVIYPKEKEDSFFVSHDKLARISPGRALTTQPSLICYYVLNTEKLAPEHIDTKLCTHIIAAFSTVDSLKSTAYLSDDQERILGRLRNATNHERNLKLMLSVGGSGNSGFGLMVSDHAHRKKFIRSLMVILKKFHLDGVDIDWEWPVISGGLKEKVKFIQLLHEIREELLRHRKKYLLSAAVAAVESIIVASYYVRHIAENVDFVNVMAYDYHFYTKLFPVTDYNAPLYSDPGDAGGVLSSLNGNYTTYYWISQGMPKEKIMLGMPTYGHTFQLMNTLNHGRHAPARGPGFGEGGFVDFPDVCEFLGKYASTVWDNASKVPYTYRRDQWISYDDIHSLKLKAQFVSNQSLGGAMVYSLNADDYSGKCRIGDFPLTKAIREGLGHGEH